MAKVIKPYDKQKGEGDIAFADFLAYLAMPMPRNLEELSKQQGKSYSHIRTHSSKFKWRARAEVMGCRGPGRCRPDLGLEAEQIAKEQLRLLEGMRTLGAAEIRRRLKLYQKDPDGDHGLTVREATMLIKEAVMLERLIIGEATERIDQMGSTPLDLSGLSGSEAEDLVRLLEKCGALDGTDEDTGETDPSVGAD